jgi:hypothetical protein
MICGIEKGQVSDVLSLWLCASKRCHLGGVTRSSETPFQTTDDATEKIETPRRSGAKKIKTCVKRWN